MPWLRMIHRWLGILLALPLLLMGLSGAVLTLEPVLPRGAPAAAAPAATVSANALLAAAVSAAPADLRPTRYLAPDRDGAPVRVQFAPMDAQHGPALVVSLDPATATPLGPAVAVAGPMEWLKRLHSSLLVPQWGGRQIAGWLGVGLLVLTVLGVPLWWPTPAQRAAGRVLDAFTVPRRARGARLHRRLHGAMGVWLWLMLLATGTTGVLQGFPQTSRAILGAADAGPPRPARTRAAAARAALPDLDAGIRLALAAVPGTALRLAILPAGPAEPLRLVLGPPGSDGSASATTVLVDQAGPAIRAIQSPSTASGGETVLRWAHDLHFGQGFGPVWRGLTVLVGLALPGFGVTGVSLWLLRRRNRGRLARAGATPAQTSLQAGE